MRRFKSIFRCENQFEISISGKLLAAAETNIKLRGVNNFFQPQLLSFSSRARHVLLRFHQRAYTTLSATALNTLPDEITASVLCLQIDLDSQCKTTDMQLRAATRR